MLERSELRPRGRPLGSLRALALPLERIFAALLVVTIVAIAAGSAWRPDIKSDVSQLRWVALLALSASAVALAWQLAPLAPVTVLERRGGALVGSLLGLCVISAVWSVDPKLTVERIVTVALVFVTAAAAAFSAARRIELVTVVIRAILVAIGLLLVSSLLLYAADPGSAVQQVGARFRGVEENPDTLPLLAAYGLPLAAWRLRSGHRRSERIAAGLCFGGILVVAGYSGSRGGLLAGAVGLLVYVWAEEGITRRGLAFGAGAVALCAASLVFKPLGPHLPGAAALPASSSSPSSSSSSSSSPRRPKRAPTPAKPLSRLAGDDPLAMQSEIGRPRVDYLRQTTHPFLGSSGRFEAWRGAIFQADQRPLLGYGFGTEDRVFIDRFYNFDGGHAESSLIGFYLQLGLVGVAALLTVVVWAMLGGVRVIRRVPPSRRPGVAALAGVVAAGGVEMLVQSYATSAGDIAMLTFWLCLGLLSTSPEWAKA